MNKIEPNKSYDHSAAAAPPPWALMQVSNANAEAVRASSSLPQGMVRLRKTSKNIQQTCRRHTMAHERISNRLKLLTGKCSKELLINGRHKLPANQSASALCKRKASPMQQQTRCHATKPSSKSPPPPPLELYVVGHRLTFAPRWNKNEYGVKARAYLQRAGLYAQLQRQQMQQRQLKAQLQLQQSIMCYYGPYSPASMLQQQQAKMPYGCQVVSAEQQQSWSWAWQQQQWQQPIEESRQQQQRAKPQQSEELEPKPTEQQQGSQSQKSLQQQQGPQQPPPQEDAQQQVQPPGQQPQAKLQQQLPKESAEQLQQSESELEQLVKPQLAGKQQDDSWQVAGRQLMQHEHTQCMAQQQLASEEQQPKQLEKSQLADQQRQDKPQQQQLEIPGSTEMLNAQQRQLESPQQRIDKLNAQQQQLAYSELQQQAKSVQQPAEDIEQPQKDFEQQLELHMLRKWKQQPSQPQAAPKLVDKYQHTESEQQRKEELQQQQECSSQLVRETAAAADCQKGAVPSQQEQRIGDFQPLAEKATPQPLTAEETTTTMRPQLLENEQQAEQSQASVPNELPDERIGDAKQTPTTPPPLLLNTQVQTEEQGMQLLVRVEKQVKCNEPTQQLNHQLAEQVNDARFLAELLQQMLTGDQ